MRTETSRYQRDRHNRMTTHGHKFLAYGIDVGLIEVHHIIRAPAVRPEHILVSQT